MIMPNQSLSRQALDSWEDRGIKPFHFASDNSYLKLLLNASLDKSLLILDGVLGRSAFGISRHYAYTVWVCENEADGKLLKNALKGAECGKIHVVIANSARVPFRAGEFDGVCVHRMPDREKQINKTLDEFALVTSKNGGALYVCIEGGQSNYLDFFRNCWNTARALQQMAAKFGLEKQISAFYYKDFGRLFFLQFFWDFESAKSLSCRMQKLKAKLAVKNRAFIFSNTSKTTSFTSCALITRIKSDIEKETACKLGDANIIRIGSGGSVIIDFENVIVRLPMSEAGRIRCIRNYETLHALRNIELPVEAPHPLAHGFVEGQAYFAESKLMGISLDLCRISRKNRESVEHDAFLLISNRKLLVTGTISGKELLDKLLEEVDYLRAYLSGRSSDCLDHIIEWAVTRESCYSIPRVIQHGDFKKSNFIVNEGLHARFSGLIDWDLSNFEGLPLLDAITLRACSADVGADALMPGIRDLIASNKEDGYLSSYCASMNICNNAANILLVMTVLHFISSFPRDVIQDSQFQRYIIDVGLTPVIKGIMKGGFGFVGSKTS
jgi:hypothetical protein